MKKNGYAPTKACNRPYHTKTIMQLTAGSAMIFIMDLRREALREIYFIMNKGFFQEKFERRIL